MYNVKNLILQKIYDIIKYGFYLRKYLENYMRKTVIFIFLMVILAVGAFADGLSKDQVNAMWRKSRQNGLDGRPKFFLWVDASHSSGNLSKFYTNNSSANRYSCAWAYFTYKIYKEEKDILNVNLAETVETAMDEYFIGRCQYSVVGKEIFQLQKINDDNLYEELKKKGVKFLVRVTADCEGSDQKTNVSSVIDKLVSTNGWASMIESAFDGNKIIVNYTFKFINLIDGEVYFAKTIKQTDKNFSFFGISGKTTREGYYDALRRGIAKFFEKECVIKVDSGEFITLPNTIQEKWEEYGQWNNFNIKIYYPSNVKLNFGELIQIVSAFKDIDRDGELKYKMHTETDSKSPYKGMKYLQMPIKTKMQLLEIGEKAENIKIRNMKMHPEDVDQDDYENSAEINFVID